MSAAVVVSTVCRDVMLGVDPVFAVAAPTSTPGPAFDALALVPGLTGGLLAIGATALVYFAEDLFARLPVHWMWWPALGGLIIGVGGVMRSPFTGIVFTLELTHPWSYLLPLAVW